MKLLVATKETQGKRKNDFSWCNNDEIVFFGVECDTDQGNPDGTCGCGRSMVGLESLKATTTMKVADVDISLGELAKKLSTHFQKDWFSEKKKADRVARKHAKLLEQLAKVYTVNTVLERRGNSLNIRRRG